MKEKNKLLEFGVLEEKIIIKHNGVVIMLDLKEAEQSEDTPKAFCLYGINILIRNAK